MAVEEPGIRRGIGDLTGVVERAGGGFAEDMLAGGQRGLGQFHVGAGGGADVDDVDGVVREQFVE